MVVGLVVLILLQSICGGNALDFMVADEGDGKSTMGIFMSERARPDDNG